MHLDEVADEIAHLLADCTIGRDSCSYRDDATSREEVANEADPPNVFIAVFSAVAKAASEVRAHNVAIEQLDSATSRPEL